ncbi:hypothetical protein EYF80_018707 [Liparis tanakae]|uniref:Uncharacterized protein n=1 Tax=Liparis tanakae TaxID=230148 RepID=A0A4Z2HZ28_9TELE|nr:hypothetical protein EYF80_018707 [Liparis tanakae]
MQFFFRRNSDLQPLGDGFQFGVHVVPSLSAVPRQGQKPSLHDALKQPSQRSVPPGQTVQLDEPRPGLAPQPLDIGEVGGARGTDSLLGQSQPGVQLGVFVHKLVPEEPPPLQAGRKEEVSSITTCIQSDCTWVPEGTLINRLSGLGFEKGGSLKSSGVLLAFIMFTPTAARRLLAFLPIQRHWIGGGTMRRLRRIRETLHTPHFLSTSLRGGAGITMAL